jgi:hypothetical protein
MKEMAKIVKVNPPDRVKQLEKFMGQFDANRNSIPPEISAELKKWSCNISSSMAKVPGRVLPPQNIVFKNSSTYIGNDKGVFEFN